MAKLNEDVKVVMLKGEKGEKGEAGTGIPTGGKTGQAIIKASDNDYDYKWGSLVVNDVANATNDGNGNNIVNTYATKAELNTAKTDASNTYLTKTDASDTYVPRIDASAKIYNASQPNNNAKIATITITGPYTAIPITLEIAISFNAIIKLTILFTSGESYDPSISLFTTDAYDGFYLYKSATSTWDLYFKQTIEWTSIGIISGFYQKDGINVETTHTIVDSIPSGAIQAVNPIFDKIYPVGAIYMTVDSAQPSILFGGTWERIKDRFLIGAGGTYGVGATGGEATHTLTISEMPEHRHYIGMADSGDGYVALMTGSNSGSNNYTTTPQGDNQPHNNMPPFLAVHIWKRIA